MADFFVVDGLRASLSRWQRLLDQKTTFCLFDSQHLLAGCPGLIAEESTHVRFDEGMPLKHDYDFTCS